MILDFPCDIDGCSAHIDLVKTELDPESGDWVHYFNCLDGHHYIRVSEELIARVEDIYESRDEQEDDINYEQLSFFDDEGGDPALD